MEIRRFATVAMALAQLSYLVTYALPALAKGMYPEEKIEYYLYDHLGGVDAVLDEQGNVIERRDYLPFGEERMVEGANDERHGFTGKELDDESGLYYYGARYYDPVIGRFTSADPLVLGEAGKSMQSFLADPQAMNGHAYALNNPIRYNDPTGKFAVLALAIPSVAQLVEAAMAGIMAYVVVRDLQSPAIESFPAHQNEGGGIETYPAPAQERNDIESFPDLGVNKPNITTIPAYGGSESQPYVFPGLDQPAKGCGLNMSCASDESRIGGYELSEHAKEQINRRGISHSDIENTIKTGESFSYEKSKIGYYDKNTNTFVGVGDKITTAINPKNPENYIKNLKERGPSK